MRQSLILIGIVLTTIAAAAADPPPLDFLFVLTYRHPEIVHHPDFEKWRKSYGLKVWSESTVNVTEQLVILDANGPPTSSAKLIYDLKVDDGKRAVTRTLFVPASEVADSYRDAEKRVRKITLDPIISSTPVVNVDSAHPIGWLLNTGTAFHKRTFKLELNRSPIEIKPTSQSCPPPGTGEHDGRSANDLHHPKISAVVDQVTRIVGKLTVPSVVAPLLCADVAETIEYDSNILNVLFTDADTVVFSRATQNKIGTGVCDEMAVVLISYLRSLDIPARLKFLKWIRAGREYGHACVEYQDETGKWVHADPTFGITDNPEFYRQPDSHGDVAYSVRVIDADWPDDARSSSIIKQVADDTDSSDGRLNMWEDFCYTPSIDGDPNRARYAFDVKGSQ